MDLVRSTRRVLATAWLRVVTPVPAAPAPHQQPLDTSHLAHEQRRDSAPGFVPASYRRLQGLPR